MSDQVVRTGSTAAPESVRAGVIRRRVRWALRVGFVLVLALVLSVAGAIRSNQQAQAMPLMLAPVGPVLVAAGPPGWAALAGAGVLLGGVYLADKYRTGDLGVPSQTPLEWFNDYTTRDAVGQGLLDWFNNEDQDKEPETDKPAGSGGAGVAIADTEVSNFREGTTDGNRVQLRFDLEVPNAGTLVPGERGMNIWAMAEYQCRDGVGKPHPELKPRNLAYQSVSPTVPWPRYPAAAACDSGNPLSMTWNPMSQENWDSMDGASDYPRTARSAWDQSIDEGFFWLFDNAYQGTDGTKITVECTNGTKITVTAKDGEDITAPQCPEGSTPDSATVERTNPDGSAHPTPVATADYKGERPLDVVVDGQSCTMGRADCANWSQIAQDSPQRVQCLSGGTAINVSHCAPVERFYENGGTVVHPDNLDGNPATRYDPRQDPNWTPLYPVQDGGGVLAPTRPGTPHPAPTSPDELPYVPGEPEAPTDPDPEPTPDDPYAPYRDPSSPLYDPAYDPAHPDYDPVKDPSNPDYSPKYDPNHPDYDPRRDPSHPDYDPYFDPDSPLYDPDYDPDAPDLEPEPEPSTPTEPEPEPTTPTEPEPTSEPEPSQEPTEDPGDGEEEPEPTDEPTEVVDPDLEPGLEPGEPPYEPPPTAVGVDEWGHLLPITASTGLLSVQPSGARVYTQPETRVATTYAPDGTRTTVFTAPEVETPTGTMPADIKTVTAPDGTKTTTGYPSVPEIKTPGSMVEAPPSGTHTPIEVTDGTCESTLCISIPEPPDYMKTKNCIRGAYSWNPVDWVKTPVLCALREAFEPSPDKLDANVQRIKIALSARGFDILIKSFEDVVVDTPGGGGGCRGPEIAWSVSGESFVMYPFDACSGAMANVAHYVHIFVTFVTGIFGMIGVIRNIAYGFGHRVQIGEGTESTS